MRKLYYLSWVDHGACYTLCFESEEERERFSKRVSYYGIKLWEAEV